MSDQDINRPVGDDPNEQQSEIFVNEYGTTKDGAVVVDEADRTVLLTQDETIVIEKQPPIEIDPKNRPRKVYAGMWGQPEIVSVGVGMLVLLTTILLYVFFVVPSKNELERNRAERDRLERELASANQKYGSITSTETHVVTLINSVSDFETRFLPVESVGKNALYQRINGLIAGHGLVNTTGPDFSPLELADGKNGDEKGRSKFRSIFPGTYVTMTLEGSYQNLRRFIADIERSNDFVVISSIELEPSDTENQQEQNAPPRNNQQAISDPSGFSANPMRGPGSMSPVAAAPVSQQNRPRGKTHGSVVSLRIELAAYFRRPNFVPAESGPVTE